MADTELGPDFTGENPTTSFARARANYEMAREDAREHVESDEECMLLGGAHSDATEALLLTEAPDLGALASKLETFAAEDCFALSPQYRDPLFAALLADVRRLVEQGASK